MRASREQLESLVRDVLRLVAYQHTDGAWQGHDTRMGSDADLMADGLAVLARHGVRVGDDPDPARDSTEDRYCPYCQRHTPQECRDSGHGRDSSYDRQTCTVCGSEYSGMGGWVTPKPAADIRPVTLYVVP